MDKNDEMISKQEAFAQVKSMIKRTALIHYAFAKTLIDELGDEKGRELTQKAVLLYGSLVGKEAKEKAEKKGLSPGAENYQDDLPSLGWHHREKVVVDGEKRSRVYTCYLAEVWKEMGAAELGRIYCYVDQAKFSAFNPELECVHVKNVLDGDPYCELAVRPKKKAKQLPP